MPISKNIFMKQPMMRKVLYSLIPVIFGAIYFFGWRTIILMSVVVLFGFLTELIFKRKQKKPVTEAVIVSAILFTLTLPVSTPFWVAIIGIIFGIAFAKEVFGGFGHNVFNPALAGRTFLYVCFPEYLTVRWNVAADTFPGGFLQYMTPAVDTMSSSTPLTILRQTGEALPLQQLFWGNVSGSMGETSVFLILIGAVILLYTKAADWRLMVSPIIGFVGLSSILTLMGVANDPGPLFGLLSGGILFVAIFFATEPITAPKNKEAKIIYGLFIGIITLLIRVYGIFVGGAMFAVLIMNTFAPIIDIGFKNLNSRKRKQVKAA
ncbi:RnfABCDGE type electron transport complex subunit D [Alkaliphilus peptidifermentans]|uniref:Na+-transporting NADH:ubiquinone oxidoreductase subunit B n=1 Tax=Alkaliphilus peptidifermentans DSM 18978 TaxID=1120976 RepID=A0A1G5CJL1_9FIRM|nr:RnfABCDGE type electron transport complex subunit D [Alkaliphilus peptidifermentans]SCY02705.1 Na+-transporting NADH:ubiquinone oxidoreductase subunit B [Alkaliphilus peptidifermentans DSM 18978]